MTRRWFSNSVILLALAAGLIAFVVQSGELGTADTWHRVESAHALWTDDPPVYEWEYPEFGTHGRGGRLQSWYGIGQSLLMVPADIVGTYVARLPVFSEYDDTDPTVRNIIVSYSTNILLCVLTALVCFRFLRQFLFSVKQSVAGTLALLVLTTHLHYTQNLMENNYICLLTLAGFSWQYEWLRSGRRRALLIGAGALGLNLLTRLTTGIDLIGCGLFLLLILWLEGERGRALWARCWSYVKVALPVYAVFGLLDRIYQFYRYGSFFNTYMSVTAQETRLREPWRPPSYPFETPFHVGFFGALFSPEKSIFLFDPLLVLTLLLIAVAWRRLRPEVKAYLAAAGAMLAVYICFYAKYTVWSGDSAWGDRYVSTAAELAALLAVPLLMRHREALGKTVWRIGLGLIAVSAVVQLASVCFWLSLELYQMEILGHPTFVVWLRMKNIVAFALGKIDAWGLGTRAMYEDPWDYQHITAWNFLPFVLQRVGVAPEWVVRTAFVVWGAGLAGLAGVGVRLRTVLSKGNRELGIGR